MCRLNGTSVCYKAGTKREMQHKRVQIHMNKTVNRKKKDMAGKRKYTRITGAKS